jgi:hypothetical protein
MKNYTKSLTPVAKATLISTIVAIVAGALVPSANHHHPAVPSSRHSRYSWIGNKPRGSLRLSHR